MKKVLFLLFSCLFALSAMATNFRYYVGPSAVTVTRNSEKNYTVTITQKGRNIDETSDDPGHVYDTKTTLVLIPLKDRLEGVYSSDVAHKANVNWISSTNTPGKSYVLKTSSSEYRYLNTERESTFTIAKDDQNTYYIVSGDIYVKTTDHTYEYHFCYDKDELTNKPEEISKKPFEFSSNVHSGTAYNYDIFNISNMVVSGSSVNFECKGQRRSTLDEYSYNVHLVFPSDDINGEYSTISTDPSRLLQSTSYVDWNGTKRYLTNEYVSQLTVVKDGLGNITIASGLIQGVQGTETSPRRYHFSEIVAIDENKNGNEVLLQNCARLSQSLDKIQLVRNMVQDTYNTFCAPFDFPNESYIESAFGDDADVRELISSSYNAEENTFFFQFSDPITSMEAGKPYLVKPTYCDPEDPIYFYDMAPTAYATEAKTVETEVVDFVGKLSPFTLEHDDDDVLFLATGNELKHSQAGTMKGMRAFFHLKQPAPAGARARIVMAPQVTTSLEEAQQTTVRKRIHDGQLLIERDGVLYNIQGIKLN